jgi:flagellar motor component MotA
MRTTGHGIAAGVGKLGAFIGVFLVPQLQRHIGLRGMLLVAAGASVLGFSLSLVLPEPARRTLEEISGEDDNARLKVDDTVLAVASSHAPPVLTEQPLRG